MEKLPYEITLMKICGLTRHQGFSAGKKVAWPEIKWGPGEAQAVKTKKRTFCSRLSTGTLRPKQSVDTKLLTATDRD